MAKKVIREMPGSYTTAFTHPDGLDPNDAQRQRTQARAGSYPYDMPVSYGKATAAGDDGSKYQVGGGNGPPPGEEEDRPDRPLSVWDRMSDLTDAWDRMEAEANARRSRRNFDLDDSPEFSPPKNPFLPGVSDPGEKPRGRLMGRNWDAIDRMLVPDLDEVDGEGEGDREVSLRPVSIGITGNNAFSYGYGANGLGADVGVCEDLTVGGLDPFEVEMDALKRDFRDSYRSTRSEVGKMKAPQLVALLMDLDPEYAAERLAPEEDADAADIYDCWALGFGGTHEDDDR